jgi:hypothetical protein
MMWYSTGRGKVDARSGAWNNTLRIERLEIREDIV